MIEELVYIIQGDTIVINLRVHLPGLEVLDRKPGLHAVVAILASLAQVGVINEPRAHSHEAKLVIFHLEKERFEGEKGGGRRLRRCNT